MTQNNWSREELIAAFNLYCKIPFTKINSRNKQIIELAGILGRSVSAVALKLANYARLDPTLKSRNISGMCHGSKSEIEIWKEFHGNWEDLSYKSELLIAKLKKTPIERLVNININELPKEGIERQSVVRVRVNQAFFRSLILASYDNKCCITGLNVPGLLVASHIVPWSRDVENRMNPHNGLCLNALHDRAFDQGFLTVTPDYKVKLSSNILKRKADVVLEKYFLPFENSPIRLPQRFLPKIELLKFHNDHIFLG
jgi:putative restriction endonuclease